MTGALPVVLVLLAVACAAGVLIFAAMDADR